MPVPRGCVKVGNFKGSCEVAGAMVMEPLCVYKAYIFIESDEEGKRPWEAI